jgi:chitin disaccharide deacetylase
MTHPIGRMIAVSDAEPVATLPEHASAHRRIWLIADDYGISRAVNTAIRDLLTRGAINATSVMVVASGFDENEARALAALRERRAIAVGLHLTLTAPFRPLTGGYAPTRHGAFLPLRGTLAASLLRRLRATPLTTEIEAQIARFSAMFGRLPDFVDGHQHVQLFPRVSDCLLAVMRRSAPHAWVRQCGRAARARADRKARVLDWMSRRFRNRARVAGVRTNPAFAGTYGFHPHANFADLFPAFLDGLPDGSVVMCHPGTVDAELARNDPLTELREREYAYFKGDDFRTLLAKRGYTLETPEYG